MKTSKLIEIVVESDNTLRLHPLPDVQVAPEHTINASTHIEVEGCPYSVFAQQETHSFVICKTYDAENDSYFQPVTTVSFDAPVATLQGFYFGAQPWLLTYHPDSEYVQFYRISSDTVTHIAAIRLGKGFTTVQPLYYRNDVFFVAYNKVSGEVVKFQVIAPAHSALYAQKAWSATWAQGWTRFAFFRLGAENFFIKTNEKYHKVNIDHFMDSIDLGSHPVLNQPASDKMLGQTDVQAFYDTNQNPYFFTYQPDGTMTFNRFRGDCKGWQPAFSSQQTANVSLIHTAQLTTRTLVLLL